MLTAPVPLVELLNVSKHFGATRALNDVTLRVWRGEVHGLVGQNGSGKSTLIKVISGFYQPDPGAGLLVSGAKVRFPVSRAVNVAVVHQDLALVDLGSVADNVLGPKWTGVGGCGPISWARARRETTRSCEILGLQVNPRTRVADLATVEKAMLACVRALADADEAGSLLLLDEPTTYMTERDAANFNAFVRGLARDREVAVLYVSHRLREVLGVCDRITVLRDGEVKADLTAASASIPQMVTAMLGRAVELRNDPLLPHGSAVALWLRGLTGQRITDLDLDVRAGEIVGVTGLVGMGQDDLPYVIRDAVGSDAVKVHEPADGAGPARRPAMSPIEVVPGERHTLGGWMAAPAYENLSLPLISQYRRYGMLRRAPQVRAAETVIRDLGVVPPEPRRPLGLFSGGNQQKLILGRALQRLPRVLVLHEPFQGVDVGARAELSLRIRSLAHERGMAVVLCSSDASDLATTCHRVLVLHVGQVAAVLVGDETTEEGIVSACQRAGELQPQGGSDHAGEK
jgi:ribose transport system ATP-binding protein